MAVVSSDGSLIATAGDPDAFAFTRSSAKPFQLAPFVASGRFDEYRLGTDALAIMAASHSGEDRHVRLVQEILRGAGLTSAVLQNQVHAPYDAETAHRLIRDRELPTALRGNCSGKHAGMVLPPPRVPRAVAYAALPERSAGVRPAQGNIIAGTPSVRDLERLGSCTSDDVHLVPTQEAKRAWLRTLAQTEPDLVVNTGDNLAHVDALPADPRILRRPAGPARRLRVRVE